MSLEVLAEHLASKGRKGDSVLVHMSPDEVHTLQALAQAHGTSLTINPDTGLPEAFSLKKLFKSVLPALAGAALSFVSGGALSPLMSGLIVGGVRGLTSGSLEKGLMAGMGAFGGAGIANALSSTGAAAAANAGQAAASPLQATATSAQGATAAFGDMAAAAPFEAGFQGTAALSGAGGVGAAPFEAGFQGTSALTGAAPSASNAASGIRALADKGGFQRFVDAQGGGMGALRNGYMAFGPAAIGMMGEQEEGGGKVEQKPGHIRPSRYDPVRQRYTDMETYEATPDNINSRFRMAEGGKTPDINRFRYDPTNQTFSIVEPTPTPSPSGGAGGGGGGGSGQAPAPSVPIGMAYGWMGPQMSDAPWQDVPYAAGGEVSGIASLGTNLPARFLQGPGDGVSDSIPAMINGQQPAAMADGEFVVPARAVSELGNGSSEAGARKLYAMVDRIQKARRKTTGKGRHAVDSDADRFLPA